MFGLICMLYMLQLYCNKKIFLARKFEGDLLANVVQGQQLGHT